MQKFDNLTWNFSAISHSDLFYKIKNFIRFELLVNKKFKEIC